MHRAAFAAALVVLVGCGSVQRVDRAPSTAGPSFERGVGERTITFVDDARDRELRTTIWYPASNATGEGSHPVVLFSHGLGAEPESYEPLFEQWTREGFVVVGPAYPLTNASVVGSLRPRDLVNQPADASFVLDELEDIAADRSDDLGRALDLEHVVAVGHSLGGMTTVGLMSDCCDEPRIDAAVILAGSGTGFERERIANDPPPVLFVHSDDDVTVPIVGARRIYDRIEGLKAFITLHAGGHTAPFFGGSDRYAKLVGDATLAWLRWNTLGDDRARRILSDLVAETDGAELVSEGLDRPRRDM